MCLLTSLPGLAAAWKIHSPMPLESWGDYESPACAAQHKIAFKLAETYNNAVNIKFSATTKSAPMPGIGFLLHQQQ
jgi:hypothetical protein